MRFKGVVAIGAYIIFVLSVLTLCAFAFGAIKSPEVKLLEEGLNAYRSKDYDTAIERLKEVLSSSPNLLSARFWLGMCYYLKGDLDAAETHWRKVLARKPNSIETRKWLSKLRTERVRRRLLPEGYEEALNAYRQKRYEDAARQLQAVVSANPKFLPALFWLGVMHLHLGNADEAIKAFAEVLKKKPSSVETMIWIGKVEEEAGRWEEALGWYRGALNINPRHREAQEQYKRLLGIVLAKYKAGVSALVKGDTEGALEELGEVAPKMQWWLDIQFWYARALIANGRYDDAINLLQAILQQRPNWTNAIYWLAEAYERSVGVDDAGYILTMALRANPNQPELRRKLMKLTKENPQSAMLAGIWRRPSVSQKPLVTFINRCPDELELKFGELEVKIGSGAQHTVELSPAFYHYSAKRNGGLAIRGCVLILGWHNYSIAFEPCPSSLALLHAYTDLVESFSSQKFTRLTITNASKHKVSVLINSRFVTIEPGWSRSMLVEPGDASYAIAVHIADDFAPGAMGSMKLAEWRSLRLMIR